MEPVRVAIALHLDKPHNRLSQMLEKLAPFLPEGALPIVQNMLREESFHLVITKPRKTKLGDFKPPHKGDTPRLTVNGNLNPYSFLITLVHEIAHLKIWHQHQNRVKPHGNEWKACYKELLLQCVGRQIFPNDIEQIVINHANKPGYSSASDAELTLALRAFDTPNGMQTLNELQPGAKFTLNNRSFVIDQKLRTRFLCTDLHNGKKYRVHGLAQVEPFHSAKLG